MVPKSGSRFPACAQPRNYRAFGFKLRRAKAGRKRSCPKSELKRINLRSFRFSLFLDGSKAQAADQNRVAEARTQIVDGVFGERGAAVDEIGRVGRGG